MLRFLFPRLTTGPEPGTDMFAWATAQARLAHWYVDGGVQDTIDGRFAVLVTITALLTLRLELAGDLGQQPSVALTERFIKVMESEHREIGIGDPALGRTVRKLVSSLARRVELWRAAMNDGDWQEAVLASVYVQAAPKECMDHTATGLRELWSRLEQMPDAAVIEGQFP